MAAKKKAAKAGAGAVTAGKAVKSNEYVQRIVEDDELRDNLRTAFESARTAIDRMSGKGPAKALMDDKKTRRELHEAAHSLREAADTLRGAKTKRKAKRRGGFLLVLLVGAGLALVLNEGLRKKALDVIFGEEEEFEYASTTSGDGGAPSSASSTSRQTASSGASGGS